MKKGHIDISYGSADGQRLYIVISDDGLGFPKGADVGRLTEPYVTHKAKGTGLGLAIVKKIMDDHNGDIYMGMPEWLTDVEGIKIRKGASVVVTLPLEKKIQMKRTQT